LQRAAAHLPRVDAIGGSAAGIYVNNEVRAASLFRGISPTDFDQNIRNIFHDLQKEWGIPFEVLNDGEVTALAGSMSLKSNAVLGVSMGTSVAAGYVTADGELTPWLNELAFVPVDYRPNAPIDEWSGDRGCAVQYFCQQGVARLAKVAGLNYGDLPFPEQLVKVQELMAQGDERAASIYRTIGSCFGYTIADWTEFYDIEKVLFLGRVSSGAGGEIIMQKAQAVLATEFAELTQNIEVTMPDETMKRHGQAIAAASLPSIKPKTAK
jgi:predicted NBD/HSP70 family sugar kinase